MSSGSSKRPARKMPDFSQTAKKLAFPGLESLRKQTGLTQAELASKADVGVGTVRNAEDDRAIHTYNYVKIYNVLLKLGVTMPKTLLNPNTPDAALLQKQQRSPTLKSTSSDITAIASHADELEQLALDIAPLFKETSLECDMLTDKLITASIAAQKTLAYPKEVTLQEQMELALLRNTLERTQSTLHFLSVYNSSASSEKQSAAQDLFTKVTDLIGTLGLSGNHSPYHVHIHGMSGRDLHLLPEQRVIEQKKDYRAPLLTSDIL